MDEDRSKSPAIPAQLTTLMIANALDSPGAHTSFGRLPLSDEVTAPIFSFGTGTRAAFKKAFLDPELLTNAIGNSSPGPKYVVQENKNFNTMPQFSFGNDPRVTLGKPVKYDHFDLKDTFTEPAKANIYVKKNYGVAKFGTESRIPVEMNMASPGPQYYPPLKPEVPLAPKFTLGARRTNPNGSALENIVSTPGLVGPGRYPVEKAAHTSKHKNYSKWSFPKSEKIPKPKRSVSKHQTYDTKNVACGPQYVSQRKSMPVVSIGNATRDQTARLGTFKDMMATQPTRVRIAHPKF
jgi:hypothetical protein